MQAAESDASEARSLVGDAEALAVASVGPARSGSPAQGQVFPAPDQARAVLVTRQIAEATGLARGGALEVSLSPEELGRVKLTMTPQEAGLAVAIQAERPETLDLLRRNIDILARELADQGFTSLSFDFGQAGGEAGKGFGGGEASAERPVVDEKVPAAGARRPAGGSADGGLDLRL